MSDNNKKPPMGENQRPQGRGGRGPGMGGMGMPAEKAKDTKGSLRKLMAFLKPYRKSLLVVIIFASFSTALAVLGPWLLGLMTTSIANSSIMAITTEQELAIDFTYLGKIAITLIIIYFSSALFNYIQGNIVAVISQKITYDLRKNISKKMSKLPLKYYDATPHGDILSRITNDVDTISNSLQQGLSQAITSAVTIIGITVMMLTISPLMTLIALVTVPLSGVLVAVTVKFSQKHFKNQQKYMGDLNGHVEEMFSGHNVVKSYNLEEKSINEFEEVNKKLRKSVMFANFLSGLMMPLMTFVGNLGYVAACVFGGYLVSQGSLSVGGIQSFIQYVRRFNQPISQLAQISNLFQSTIAASERVFEFLEENEEIPEKNPPALIENVKGNVTFENVSFGYLEDKIILKNINLDIKSGQTIAIVGPTGAGKTTVINLLMRFYDVNNGSIKIDGVDIRDMKRSDLRQIFGMVLQDTWLFSGTIMENLAYGRENASEEEIQLAAKSAHCLHFINTHPDGFNMEINEEATNISQGQKQLLTIARAILADPPILILDEATSSVDTRTETRIQKAMNNLMKGRTSFVIAHRLSTIRDADVILVMRDGDIIEHGSHEELMKQQGFYSDLYNSQFEKSAG